MAYLFPDEGLDLLLQVIRGGAFPGTLYCGLFTSQTPLTVPTRSSSLRLQMGVTEASGTRYGRAAVSSAAWGAPTTSGLGRRIVASTPATFDTVGPGGWGSINGFFLSDGPAPGTGSALMYANFDDLTPIVTASNDTIQVAPFLVMRGQG